MTPAKCNRARVPLSMARVAQCRLKTLEIFLRKIAMISPGLRNAQACTHCTPPSNWRDMNAAVAIHSYLCFSFFIQSECQILFEWRDMFIFSRKLSYLFFLFSFFSPHAIESPHLKNKPAWLINKSIARGEKERIVANWKEKKKKAKQHLLLCNLPFEPPRGPKELIELWKPLWRTRFVLQRGAMVAELSAPV